MILEQKYNCVVIDDEHLARKLLKDYISKIPALNLIGCYDSPLSVVDDIKKHNVKIIFIDIEMPDILGIDFIQQLPFKPHVVFVTAFSEYAAKAFEIDAVEYLLKPVTFSRFLKAINKLMTIINTMEKANRYDYEKIDPTKPNEQTPVTKDFILIKTERKVVKVLHDDIFFIEGALEYVSFQLEKEKIMGLFSLKKLEEELPHTKFMRIHKSYIVALKKITEVEGNQVKVGKWQVTVSKTARLKLLERISK